MRGGVLAWSGTLYVTNVEEMSDKESSYAGCNPVEGGGLLHSLWGRRCDGVATASRIAEGSGKDRDSFGFDFRVVAAVIPPP